MVAGISASTNGSAVAVVGDVSQSSTFKEAVDTAVSTFGELNYAFNCAGTEGPLTPISETSDDSFMDMINTKLTGCFLGLKAQIPVMREKGVAIVNMVGSFGHIGYPYMGAYCAAAHGVLGLTRTAALEEGQHNIRVNAVCPGAVETDLLTRMMGGDKETQRKVAAVQTMKQAGVTSEQLPDSVVNALTRDYSDLMKHDKMKSKK